MVSLGTKTMRSKITKGPSCYTSEEYLVIFSPTSVIWYNVYYLFSFVDAKRNGDQNL